MLLPNMCNMLELSGLAVNLGWTCFSVHGGTEILQGCGFLVGISTQANTMPNVTI